jgi:hypothetical protein
MLDWIGAVLGREGLVSDWTQAAPWFGVLLALSVATCCWWLRRKARLLAGSLRRENAALTQMTQLAWSASRKAYEEVEALRAEIQDLNDKNKSLEGDLRWLGTKAQEDRAVFVRVLRRCIQAVNYDEDRAFLAPERPLLAYPAPTAARTRANSQESLTSSSGELTGYDRLDG